jgi:hypothetical protein
MSSAVSGTALQTSFMFGSCSYGICLCLVCASNRVYVKKLKIHYSAAEADFSQGHVTLVHMGTVFKYRFPK